MIDLELPLEKRTKQYRFFEMMPALISYGMFVTLAATAFINPFFSSICLLVVIVTVLFRSFGIALHAVAGYRRLKQAHRINWQERLGDLADPEKSYERIKHRQPENSSLAVHYENLRLVAAQPSVFPKPDEVTNVVIMAALNEPYEIIHESMQNLQACTDGMSNVVVVFAYEERGGAGIANTAKLLEAEFSSKFKQFISIKHPANLDNEIVGKGANITYAAQKLESMFRKQKVDINNVIITTMDCDNKPHKNYFWYTTYEFIVHENRKQLSFQPIALYFSNIWDAPAPMRVIAVGNSFWTIVSSMRPHTLRNFAAHSQPMEALREMNYWSKRSIVEDGHQYWRSYFFFGGNYEVVPIFLPIYQDTVVAKDLKSTFIAQFKQLRRWAYGASDIPYVATRIFTRQRNVPFWPSLARFIRLIDSHVSLATVAVITAVGGWLPLLINPNAEMNILAHNLPSTIGWVQTIAMIGLFITIWLTLRLLPPRPKHYSRKRSLSMILQWFLMPITAILFNAMASIVAQTHLLLGKYLTKFDVTEKAKKNSAKS